MSRTKYTYKNRAEAEQACKRAESAAMRAEIATAAMISGDYVAWPKMIGCYRVRMVPRSASVLLIIWQPQATGGRFEIHDAESYCKRLDGEAGYYDADGRRVSFHARRIVADYYKRQTIQERGRDTLAASVAAEFSENL